MLDVFEVIKTIFGKSGMKNTIVKTFVVGGIVSLVVAYAVRPAIQKTLNI